MQEENNNSVQDQSGNKSKPLLANRLVKFRIYYKLENEISYHNIEMIKETQRVYTPIVKTNGEILCICQFTGFIDKNNNEIYEGDILKREHSIYEVLFKDGAWLLTDVKDYYKESFYYLHLFDFLKTEIIGNIFENVNLLPNVL